MDEVNILIAVAACRAQNLEPAADDQHRSIGDGNIPFRLSSRPQGGDEDGNHQHNLK